MKHKSKNICVIMNVLKIETLINNKLYTDSARLKLHAFLNVISLPWLSVIMTMIYSLQVRPHYAMRQNATKCGFAA